METTSITLSLLPLLMQACIPSGMYPSSQAQRWHGITHLACSKPWFWGHELGSMGIFLVVCNIQREGECEQLLTTEMSHIFPSGIEGCDRQGTDTEVILFSGCTILWWQSLVAEASREKWVSNTMPKRKLGETMCL